MPEDSFEPKNIHYGIMNGGVFERIGEIVEPVSFPVDNDVDSSQSYFHELMAEWSGTMSLKVPWWAVNRISNAIGIRAPYLVANLRRGGKSHKGKARSICRAT